MTRIIFHTSGFSDVLHMVVLSFLGMLFYPFFLFLSCIYQTTADKIEHCCALMERKRASSSRRLVPEWQKLDDRRGCTHEVSSGKSNPLSSLALKVGEQVHLCKQGGGELPQQFSLKLGEAVEEGGMEREKEGVCDRKVRTGTDGETQGIYSSSHLKTGAIHSRASNISSPLNDLISVRSH